MKPFVALLVLLVSPLISAKVFTKCEVAQYMFAEGHPKELLPEWVCLVNSESSFNSSTVGGPNTNGSFDWGLFQINDNYWCTTEGVGNDCNINCSDLIDDDITDDLVCVAKIYARHGFLAWHGWSRKCQDGLEDWQVDECFA